jgi:hypothetical protein
VVADIKAKAEALGPSPLKKTGEKGKREKGEKGRKP